MAEQRLPVVNGDDGAWGNILNQYLEKEHYNTGVNNTSNGGHKNITIRPGTTVAGTAPIKLSSGPLMTNPEAGAIEFLTDKLYFTQTTGVVRKSIAYTEEIKYTPTAIWGDGVSATSVQAGVKTYLRVPYGGTITSWTLVANTNCSCVIDVWKANGVLPTIVNTITSASKPSLSASATAISSTLTGWNTVVSIGDVFCFSLYSVSGSPASVTLVLNVTGA